MTKYVFEPEQIPSVPVQGTDLHYAVSRIFCVGRNYAAHAREMGFDPDREPPFYFTKPANALILTGSAAPYPPGTQDYQHEMELVIAIGKPAYKVSVEQAKESVYGYACGLDMTRRDLQIASREKGRPWSFGKAFENSAVISPIVPASVCGALESGKIHLEVNGQVRQSADLADLIWSIPEVISNLSQFYHLKQGDLIYTGTPEGVGKVQVGDKLKGYIDKLGDIEFTVSAAQ